LPPLLREHLSVVDEVALFDSVTHHLYIPLDDYARRMEVAARRLDAFRQSSVPSAGINVLTTIGHIIEGWSYMPSLPFQAMVEHDGSVSAKALVRHFVNWDRPADAGPISGKWQ
jgi:hypothetical protein